MTVVIANANFDCEILRFSLRIKSCQLTTLKGKVNESFF